MERTIDRCARRAAALALVLALLAGCGGGSRGADDAVAASREDAALDEAAVVQVTAVASDTGDATRLAAAALGATVTVPDTALGGVDAAAITAEVYRLDRPEDDLHAITFALGPDGSRFAAPVLLEWDGAWSPSMVFGLRATQGDGTLLADAGSPTASSIVALRVTPTSSTTAHFVLPVDHFSDWTVYSIGVKDLFVATADVPESIEVGRTQELSIDAYPVGRTLSCVTSSFSTGGLIEVRAPVGLQCAVIDVAPVHHVTLRCTTAGVDQVRGVLYGITATPKDGGGLTENNERELRRQLMRSAYAFGEAARHEVLQDRFGTADTALRGVTFAVSFQWEIRCVDPSTPATTTVPTTTRPAAGAFGQIGVTGPTGPKGPTGPVGATGPTGTAPQAPATTAAPATTVPATTVPPTTSMPEPPPSFPVPTTLPPDAPWGQPGHWAFNERGTCDYNSSGGCGWYYGRTRGEYLLGPLGEPGATIPV